MNVKLKTRADFDELVKYWKITDEVVSKKEHKLGTIVRYLYDTGYAHKDDFDHDYIQRIAFANNVILFLELDHHIWRINFNKFIETL